MEDARTLLAAVASGRALTRDEAEAAFGLLLTGEASAAQTGAILMGLRVRGETVEEIAGAVAAMRARMLRVKAPPGAIDIVGTGGDGHGTYNVSTLAAIIVAACGVPVAKHGNRAASSRSGASDVLGALGLAPARDAADVERCLGAANIGFMAAPVHHAAMRHVMAVRGELGTRTIFNLLGPLSNPAGVTRLLVGTYSAQWLEPLALVLGSLGAEKAWLVHGADGLDELSTTGPSEVVAWDGGALRRFTIDPEAHGLRRATLSELLGGDPSHNAAALRRVLDGVPGAYRDIAVLNAAAALVMAGRAADIDAGVTLAAEALDTGLARATLERLVVASQTRRDDAALAAAG